MTPATHQTIKLSKGKHSSPQNGACVMELASMLAGESFSDHPSTVCPVIGSFLREYNDSIDDDRRQDLYVYAAKIVGSRTNEEMQRVRVQRLAAWGLALKRHRWTSAFIPERLRYLARTHDAEIVGRDAVRAIPRHSDGSHADVLALIDELLRIGGRHTTEPRSVLEGQDELVNPSGDRECMR